MIFDVKMGENFRRKTQFLADVHKTHTPAAMAYSYVVSRDSVKIALAITVLNNLEKVACDIHNVYFSKAMAAQISRLKNPHTSLHTYAKNVQEATRKKIYMASNGQ